MGYLRFNTQLGYLGNELSPGVLAMKHVLVVGAGLSGLSACLEIEALGGSATLFEKTSAIGGRVATYSENGFYFDRGLQVLLSSYP